MPDSSQNVPVIAVASRKGGTGKTTVAANPALASAKADAYQLIAEQVRKPLAEPS